MNAADICAIIGSIFGILGSILIIILFVYFGEGKLFYKKLILILSIYDLSQSISYILPGKTDSLVCSIQMYLIGITGLTSQYWSCSISIISYLKVVKDRNDKYLEKLYKSLHLLMWILVFFCIVIIAVFGSPTHSDTYWCWCKQKGITGMMYFFYWTFLVLCLIFYILTVARLKRNFQKIMKSDSKIPKETQMTQLRIQLRMTMIPLIYIILLIPSTIKRVHEFIIENPNDWISVDVLQSIFITTHGFWDFLIFIVFNEEMRKKISESCFGSSNNLEFYQISDFDTIKDFVYSDDEDSRLKEFIN
ncbi:g protein-coupled receptor [Anaeramoeba ignava]|uniref:G protein-coupled receptor n=1 Tax=Anaeramoeba ignava TaxID=1746090 RepID=A0A9Q0LKK2_ANAIG|nr:g protein-coupled receptor [Anaeramoeba ignava]